MDIFSAVIFDNRSVVPNSVNTFTTLKEAKEFVEGTVTSREGSRWEEWDEGRWVFGYGTEDIDEPIGAVYGSELEGTQQ